MSNNNTYTDANEVLINEWMECSNKFHEEKDPLKRKELYAEMQKLEKCMDAIQPKVNQEYLDGAKERLTQATKAKNKKRILEAIQDIVSLESRTTALPATPPKQQYTEHTPEPISPQEEIIRKLLELDYIKKCNIHSENKKYSCILNEKKFPCVKSFVEEIKETMKPDSVRKKTIYDEVLLPSHFNSPDYAQISWESFKHYFYPM